MKYGYLLNGNLITIDTPKKVVVGDKKYFNPTREHIIASGYKEVREDEMPTIENPNQEIETKIYENEDIIYVKHLLHTIEEPNEEVVVEEVVEEILQ